MELPITFLNEMQTVLGEEYPAYLESFQAERVYGLRVNTAKISPARFLELSPFALEPIPWIENGFYYCGGGDKPAKHPYYFAGLYYLQEPSAMTPANRLPVRAGDRVLDLCAAPGGKSTELGAKLNGTGMLVTNDISNSRAKALLKNVELFGIENAVVLSEAPYKLSGRFPEFFDKILIDAPCSGEGMFRKEPAVIKSWLEKDDPNAFYAKLQREILREAVKMLKPDGMLMYSTCTFSPKENEETVAWLLHEFPSLSVCPVAPYEGFGHGLAAYCGEAPQLADCVRIWPHKMRGEGHFVTLLKNGAREPEAVSYEPFYDAAKPDGGRYPKGMNEEFIRFLEDYIAAGRFAPENFCARGERIYYIPPQADVRLDGLRVMRNGLLMGECRKNRFEPSQALAMALKAEDFRYVLSLPAADERVIRYLKGETIPIPEESEPAAVSAAGMKLEAVCPNGAWVLFCVDGYPLGFAKAVNGMLKNKYLSGWRWQ